MITKAAEKVYQELQELQEKEWEIRSKIDEVIKSDKFVSETNLNQELEQIISKKKELSEKFYNLTHGENDPWRLSE